MSASSISLSVASDLKACIPHNTRKAFIITVILHLSAFYAIWFWMITAPVVCMTPYTDTVRFTPGPVLAPPDLPELEVITPSKPVIGIPEPVDDLRISPSVTLASQEEMRQQAYPIEQIEDETVLQLDAPVEEKIIIKPAVLPESDTFVPYNTPPQPIKPLRPAYTEMARLSELEGLVVLHVLVDSEGHVREVKVLKSLGGGLDEEAVKSVKTSKWVPAIQNDRPVAVWISVPIRFRLR